ncbi:hypothetical protein AC578_2852 [Pseudocercospora eumusae]|uniref:Uncharacterized protein n=1 Tax=Pseudocercospora eumusae TaxID=321146 RepID=A0A139H408_9PEZI|nr:hypothetical protein AC578_2852 [Pseudocercospora eumusae]
MMIMVRGSDMVLDISQIMKQVVVYNVCVDCKAIDINYMCNSDCVQSLGPIFDHGLVHVLVPADVPGRGEGRKHGHVAEEDGAQNRGDVRGHVYEGVAGRFPQYALEPGDVTARGGGVPIGLQPEHDSHRVVGHDFMQVPARESQEDRDRQPLLDLSITLSSSSTMLTTVSDLSIKPAGEVADLM